MDKEQINKIIHELTPIGQTFRNYTALLENDFFNVSHATMKKMCGRCAKICLELRNIVITEIEEAR